MATLTTAVGTSLPIAVGPDTGNHQVHTFRRNRPDTPLGGTRANPQRPVGPGNPSFVIQLRSGSAVPGLIE